MSTPKAIATFLSVARSGWAELVHHFETVAGSLSNSAASHLFVRLRSARTTFMRFKSFISISRFIAFGTNLVRIYGIRMKISVFSLLNVIHVITNDHLRGLWHPVYSMSATPSKARLNGFCNKWGLQSIATERSSRVSLRSTQLFLTVSMRSGCWSNDD